MWTWFCLPLLQIPDLETKILQDLTRIVLDDASRSSWKRLHQKFFDPRLKCKTRILFSQTNVGGWMVSKTSLGFKRWRSNPTYEVPLEILRTYGIQVDQVDAMAVSPWIINGNGNGMFQQGWLNQQVVDWISHVATFFLFYLLNDSFLRQKLMVIPPTWFAQCSFISTGVLVLELWMLISWFWLESVQLRK